MAPTDHSDTRQESQDRLPLDGQGDQQRGLASRSFQGLLATQLFGAANDNIFRWLVIGVAKQFVEKGNISNVLMAGTACFVLPYLLLAAPAGYLADRYSKRKVIVVCKMAEMLIMSLGVVALLWGNLWFLFLIVAMMGAQTALFGPAKLGSIPEMLRPEKISAANGLVGLVTVVATVAGMAAGNILADVARGVGGEPRIWPAALVLIGVAGLGLLGSLAITRLQPANPQRTFPWNAAKQTYRDLATLASSRPMLRVALGVMFFWSLGSLAMLNIDQFAFEGGATVQTQIVPLLISLVSGVGLGSVLAGVWSGGRVELGILPLGAGGVALSSILLFTVEGTLIQPGDEWTLSYAAACLFLFMLGSSAGLFDVPLEAYMQHRSRPESRGSILAASNFMTFGGILATAFLFSALRAPLLEGSLENVLASPAARDEPVLAESLWNAMRQQQAEGQLLNVEEFQEKYPDHQQLIQQVYGQVVGQPLFTSRHIFLLCGVFTIGVFVYIVWLIPQASIRFFVWLATHTVYRVRVEGRENLPETAGALLVANHVTWADGILLLATSSRPVRLMIDADWIRGPVSRWLARTMGAIPIKPTPKSVQAAYGQALEAVQRGDLVCIFPEGGITPTGHMRRFRPRLLEMLKTASVPVIPVYLDELWGSIFSYRGDKFRWQWPQARPNRVSIWFGRPLAHDADVGQVQQAVQDLGAEAVKQRTTRGMLLPHKFVRRCRQKMFRPKVADSSRAELTGGALLMRTLILRRLLLREVLDPHEEHVGLLLPPSVGAVVVNAAVTLARRVTANLNYTVTSDVMNACIARAGIRHVLTSRRVTEKFDFDLDAEMVYLEDFKDKVTLADKLVAALQTYLVPAALLDRLLGLHEVDADDVMTVIFTSGSTGEPKGVQLTHRNVLSNADAVGELFHLRADDVTVGILPFFHSFGFTVPLWTTLGQNVKGVYHFNPLDAKEVGKLSQTHGGTILLGTPTFLRSYIRRCSPDQLESLEIVVVGAEKMPIDLANAFENKFGVRPVEGYGTTELSPLVSVNVPPSRSLSSEVALKEGTVGKPIPGVSAKVVDPDTWEDLPHDTSGMLLIIGPNVMKGYLGQPEKTAEVIRDRWYVTGDIAMIDRDGFITITGRQSRFSKIGGEMVPHLRIEEELQRVAVESEDELTLAVTAVPDERKGERIVVLYTKLSLSIDEACRQLSAAGLPNLWIPAQDCFWQVDEIPVLGTGKLDLQRLKQLALEKAGTAER